MKLFKILMLCLVAALTGISAVGQANASINVLTQNSGQVALGGTVYIQVDVGNTGPTSNIGVNKVRAQISIPIAIATAVPNAQQDGLPPGWIILTNTGGAIQVCNGTDVIPVNTVRTVLIKVQGTSLGGPSTVTGVLSFGPGSGVCTGPGSLPGDITADNTSSSTIQVIPAPACNLSVSVSAGTIACNGGTATLTATPTGASGAVEYSITGGAPFQAGNTFTVSAGTYTVTAREISNPSCTATATAVTITEPTAITASASAGTIACNGGTTTLTVTASGGTAPLQYSLNGGAFQAGNTFGVVAGTYTVTVKDANNCTATTNSVTVNQPSAITASLAALTTTICNGATTTLTVTASGGTAPLQYSLNGGAFQAGNTFTIGAGTYTVSVKDANNCTATTNSVTVTASSAITASVSAGAPILCNGGTTTLTVTASGGTAPLQYSLNGGAFQSGNTFTVGAGTYTVTVRDANLCTATTNSVTITQPAAIVVNASAPPIALPGGTTTITASATGGTSPYQFSLNGGAFQAGNTFTVSAGSYTITARDANLCTGSTTITLNDPTPGNANASINLLTLNSGQVNQGGVVDLQVSVGNTGPSFIGVNKVRAQISIPIAIASALANGQQTGLPPGWTILTNTGGSITICNGSDQIPANTVRNILIKIQGNTAGGPSTITGVLSFGPGTGVCTGPGSLPGDITADNTSTSTIQVISNCNLTASASAGTIACNGGTTTLTVTATGGAGAVEYSLNGGAFQAGNTLTVGAGTYTVTVRETANQSCSATTNSITVTQPSAITASASAGTIVCNGGTTTLTVTASGGTAPLQYSLNGGAFQPGNTFTVAAGTYTVSVKDANNCTATANSVTVTQPTAITALLAALTTTICNGATTTLTVTASGGTAPLQYSLNGGAFQGGNTFTVGAGTYTVSVKDANNCTATTNSITVTASSAITASASAGAPILCNGGTTTLTVTASGGTAPLQYSLNGGAFQSGNTFTVGAGSYTVTVRDANLCTATTNSVTVTQPAAIVVNASAPPIALPGGTTTITASATGGTSPYQFSLNGGAFQAGNTFTVSAGTYTITARDANLCTAFTTVTISDPTPGNANASINLLTLNSGQVNQGGVVDLQVSVGNTGPSFIGVNKVRAQISIPIAIASALANGQQTGLPPGWTILTNTGGTITICNGTDQIPANTVRNILIKIQGNTAGGPSTITGVLSFGPGTGVCTGPGSLPGDITADNTSTSTIQVISTCNLTASASAGTIACNGGTTTLTVTATGGTAPLQYSLNGGAFQSGNTFTVGAGTYTVSVKDANDCTATTNSVTVTEPSAITASASAGTIACNGGTTTLTVTASGGTAPLQYSLNGGAFQSGNTFTVGAGTYTVTVKDANNCTATTNSVTITEPTAITASASATTNTVACNGTTTLTVTASGGTAPLQYSLNGGAFQGGNTFTVGAGTYTVTVKDANNCTATTNSVTITTAADNINPTITAPASITVNTNENCTATGVNLGTPVTADNCTVASVTNNAPAAFPLGATTVTWTVTDGSGNTATATQTVTVTDNVRPVVYFQGSSLIPGTTSSSSQTPYLLPTIPGVKLTSIISVNDVIGGYRMAGIPDGLGAFDNNDGTFTLLMNHEIGNTLGVNRAHGSKGAFVSRWVINKSTLQVISGSDLMQQVYLWNNTTQSNLTSPGTFAFNRFCSADLPPVSAYYNAATGLGTQTRIYMNGEEGGNTGYQMGHVASGPDAGKSYVLGKFNLATNGSGINAVGASENTLANPFPQNKTVVISTNDGGTGIMTNAVSVYVGTKTNTGSEVDKAGLNNGTLKFVVVAGNPVEIVNNTTRATNITSGAAFTLSGTSSTTFSRPEDGAWDPSNPSKFYFVTTDQLDQVADGLGSQVGRSRLWRLNFTDITNPDLGGTIDLLLDGTEGQNMLDNMTIDKFGHILLNEDVGNAAHNGKIWEYTIATDAVKIIAKHDPARFGDRQGGVTTPATAPFNADEESSGILDVSSILGPGMFLVDVQAHYAPAANTTEVVEGGQLLALFNPASIASTVSAAPDTIRSCSGTGVNLGTPATADNCSVASLTNDAPATFPAGNTTVTWTVTDGSGNTSTATQVVVVSTVSAPTAGTITQPTCTVPTGSVVLNGLPSGNWTITRNPGGVTTTGTGASTTISGLVPGTYTFTATNAAGCTSSASADVVINNVPGAPDAPTVGIVQPTCTVVTGTITITSVTTGLTFSLDGGAYAAYPASGYVVATGSHTLTAQNAGGCISPVTNIIVNAQPATPAAPTVNVVQPTCTVATGTITVTSTTTGLTFSLDGGAYAAYPASGYIVAAGSHTLTAKNADGCISGVANITVNAQPATPAAPTVGPITHPTCSVPTGSVILTGLPSGNWTITRSPGGVTTTGTGANTTISGLVPGTYTFTVTNTAGCTSSASADVIINNVPGAPDAPTVSVAQPTCAVPNGTITITSATTGLTFSLDGGAYAAYPAAGYVAAAGSHTLTAQNASGCISAVTNITVNVQPAIPAAPTVNVVQPTCTVATGTITVTSSTTGLTFSLDGGAYAAYPAGGYVVATGSHTLTAQNASGCISAVTNITVNTQPATPAAPTVNVVQPTCAVATGTITVTSSTVGLTFSLDGGAYAAYPASGYVVAAGSHTLTAKNADGCISSVTNITVNAQPATPAAPTVNVVQPTCTVAAGTIAVTSSTVGLTFSLDGGAYAAYPAGGYVVTSGSHTLTAQNASGCTSAVTNITVNAQPATPSAPIVGTITQPTCTVATGSVVLSGLPSGNWTITRSPGGATTTGTGAGTTISGLAAGTYTFTVTNAAGCTSSASANVVINAQPASPSAPTVGTITQPSACVATGSVVLNGLPSGNWTITRNPGGVTTTGTGASATISGLAAGTYTFTVTNAAGCTSSASANVVINAQPAPLAVTTTTVPASGGNNGTATANPTGGTLPYTYSWNTVPVQTTQTATGLAAGTYTVTVTDARGCTATATATVTSGCGVIASAGTDQTLCPGGTVTLTASATGGSTSTPPGPQVFTELPTSVSDTRLFSGNIDYIAIGNTFSQNEAGQSCLNGNCGQNPTASKTLTLPAGAVIKKAYLYWSGSGSVDNTVVLNGSTITAENTKTDNISGVGSFFGARADVTSKVTSSGTYTVSGLTWSNASSYCQWNGAYGAWGMVVVYEMSSLPAARIHINTEKFDMTYPAGTYSSTINNISVPAGCTPNAKLTIIAFEGDNYKSEKYRIAGVLDADPNNFRGQAGPNLDIITKNAPSIVGGTTSLAYSIESYQQSYCAGNAIEALFDYVKVLKYNSCPTGPCNDYKYEWKKNGTVVGTTKNITVSSAGTYTVKVTDCANCAATDDVVVSASILAATSTVGAPIACYGGTTTVTISGTGGTAPYTGTGVFIRGAGTCSFTVTDAKGCTAVTTVTITQPSQLTATATAPQIPCGSTTTTVTVSAGGGTSPYQYSLNGGAYQSGNTFTVGNGSYTITVKDAKACTKTATVTVTTVSCGPVDPNKCYKLIARHSGKAATVANSSTSNGGNVEQRSYSGGNNQVWKFVQVQAGYYEIINVNSGKVLDVQGGSTSNGANIQQWTYGGGDNQKWSLTANGSYFVIKAKHSGKAMSVENSSTSNGANVEQRGNGNDYNQQWSIVEVGCPQFNTRTKEQAIEEEDIQTELSVTVSPNPSISYFNLTVKSDDNNTPVSVRILDANGKVMSVHPNVAVNNTLRIGSDKWTGGMYFAEVTQGDKRKVVKLVRAN